MAESKLSEYRRKRRADATNEPFGDEGSASTPTAFTRAAKGETLEGAFVVHLHDATRRHYDVRLEVSGVLASFAVPRGPSSNPDDRHLAVKTEDHPIEYLEFEDVIPRGQYGAGPMIAWDRGSVTYLEGPAEQEIENGKLHVELRGTKLRGRWALVKLQKKKSGATAGVHGEREGKGNEWLFFKKQDEHADRERVLIDELPRSVLSGLTIEELERKEDIGRALVARAARMGAPARKGDVPPAEAFPARTKAEPASLRGARWRYDPVLEGVRVVASREGGAVTLRTDDAPTQDVAAFYPDVVRALRALSVDAFTLLGDLVAFDGSGHPRAELLAERARRFASGDAARATTEIPVVLMAIDLLALGERDTRPLSLDRRRELLSALAPGAGFVRTSSPLRGDVRTVVAACAEHRIARIEAKRRDAAYPASPDDAFRLLETGVTARAPVIHHGGATTREVTVTNRGKIFWPAQGFTKGDLCDYYAAVAPVLLPHLRDRPVILVRYPDGIEGKNFFQWNVPPGLPSWVRTLEFKDDEGSRKRGFLVDDPATLATIANLGCIPLHVLACRVPRLEEANFFTIDFDVKQGSLKDAVVLVETLRELLDEVGLPGFPKTSGQTGLHVLVPLGQGQSFATARALADLLGRLLVDRWPRIATMERIVKRRGPKVYVDTGQTGPARAIVAPYSVRAVSGATVSTPLTWDEVTPRLDPRTFTIETVPPRVERLGDLMKGLVTATPDVERAVEKLARIVGTSTGSTG